MQYRKQIHENHKLLYLTNYHRKTKAVCAVIQSDQYFHKHCSCHAHQAMKCFIASSVEIVSCLWISLVKICNVVHCWLHIGRPHLYKVTRS